MANRNFPNKAVYTNHYGPVMIDVAVTIGATGAVSSISTANNFIASVTRASTGLYTVNLSNPYNRVIMVIGSATSPGSGTSGVLAIETQTAPNTNITSLTAPSVGIKTLDAAGALVDPASGSTITILLYLSNSSLG